MAWDLLIRGAHDRRSPFHTPTLATSDADGACHARIAVLRGASRNSSKLRFHTDRRSRKIAQLDRDPRCAILGYDPGKKIQIRLLGVAKTHTDDEIAEDAWAASQPQSRACYMQGHAPGAPLSHPDEAQLDTASECAIGRRNFCVLLIEVETLEWLYLHHLGHRRAAWTRQGEVWTGGWIAP